MNIFFIIGCARSGTSILGELIASHPDVTYIFEAHGIWELAGKGQNEGHRLIKENATPIIKKKIREWFSDRAEKNKILVEKNPRNSLRIPFIRAIFPEARFIHIIRDGRDTACSMIPGCGGEEWRHLKPPDWQLFYSRYQGAVRCAHAWKQVIEIALNDLHNVDHIQIKYEELVASPIETSKKIFGYLQMEPHQNVIDFCSLISNQTNDGYQAKIQTKWVTSDHNFRIGRWQENLTQTEKDEINELLKPTLARIGYID